MQGTWDLQIRQVANMAKLARAQLSTQTEVFCWLFSQLFSVRVIKDVTLLTPVPMNAILQTS